MSVATTVVLLPATRHWQIYQGDTVAFQVVVKEDDVAINHTGSTFDMTIKRQDGSTVLALTNGTGITVASGGATIRIESDETADLPLQSTLNYDIQWTSADDDIRTLVNGTITVSPQVTA